jgi:hypothetical protein
MLKLSKHEQFFFLTTRASAVRYLNMISAQCHTEEIPIFDCPP